MGAGRGGGGVSGIPPPPPPAERALLRRVRGRMVFPHSLCGVLCHGVCPFLSHLYFLWSVNDAA